MSPIDENEDGLMEYILDNPDFNFLQFRSNLVIRWEYTPGQPCIWCGHRDEQTACQLGDFPILMTLKTCSTYIHTMFFSLNFHTASTDKSTTFARTGPSICLIVTGIIVNKYREFNIVGEIKLEKML